MIVSRKKPIEAVLAMLEGVKKVGLVGCKSCASACAVGGEKECLEMKAFLLMIFYIVRIILTRVLLEKYQS